MVSVASDLWKLVTFAFVVRWAAEFCKLAILSIGSAHSIINSFISTQI